MDLATAWQGELNRASPILKAHGLSGFHDALAAYASARYAVITGYPRLPSAAHSHTTNPRISWHVDRSAKSLDITASMSPWPTLEGVSDVLTTQCQYAYHEELLRNLAKSQLRKAYTLKAHAQHMARIRRLIEEHFGIAHPRNTKRA